MNDKKVLTITICEGKLDHKFRGPWTRRDLEAAFKHTLRGLPEYIRDLRRKEEASKS